MQLKDIKEILEDGELNLEVSLSVDEDGYTMFVANEDGTGASYTVDNAEEIGLFLVEYVKNYCEE